MKYCSVVAKISIHTNLRIWVDLSQYLLNGVNSLTSAYCVYHFKFWVHPSRTAMTLSPRMSGLLFTKPQSTGLSRLETILESCHSCNQSQNNSECQDALQ